MKNDRERLIQETSEEIRKWCSSQKEYAGLFSSAEVGEYITNIVDTYIDIAQKSEDKRTPIQTNASEDIKDINNKIRETLSSLNKKGLDAKQETQLRKSLIDLTASKFALQTFIAQPHRLSTPPSPTSSRKSTGEPKARDSRRFSFFRKKAPASEPVSRRDSTAIPSTNAKQTQSAVSQRSSSRQLFADDSKESLKQAIQNSAQSALDKTEEKIDRHEAKADEILAEIDNDPEIQNINQELKDLDSKLKQMQEERINAAAEAKADEILAEIDNDPEIQNINRELKDLDSKLKQMQEERINTSAEAKVDEILAEIDNDPVIQNINRELENIDARLKSSIQTKTEATSTTSRTSQKAAASKGINPPPQRPSTSTIPSHMKKGAKTSATSSSSSSPKSSPETQRRLPNFASPLVQQRARDAVTQATVSEQKNNSPQIGKK